MKYHFLLLFALQSFISYGQQPIERLPLELSENIIFIQARVNDDTAQYNFMFDTGAGVTVLAHSIAEKIDLTITGESRIRTSGRTIIAKSSEGNTLRFGNKVELKQITLEVISLTHLSSYFGFPVDGIIGFDLLNNLVVETNFDKNEMLFYDTASFTSSNTRLDIIPLEYNHFGTTLSFRVKKNQAQVTGPFKVDTGCGYHLVLHNKTVNTHNLHENKKHKVAQGFGADSTITNNLKSKVKSVSLADTTWKNVPVILEIDAINTKVNQSSLGLLGQKLLLDFNITYDLTHHYIYLEKR